jgi:hypothetical protein
MLENVGDIVFVLMPFSCLHRLVFAICMKKMALRTISVGMPMANGQFKIQQENAYPWSAPWQSILKDSAML